MTQKQIKGLNLDELITLCEENNFSSFRAKQLYHWMYRHGTLDTSQINNLPDEMIKFIEKNYVLKTLEIERVQDSNIENTKKILFRTSDGNFIESVSMIDKNLHTVCISSQVGCSVDCKFCATGMMGFNRNLSCGEIIDQIIEITKLRDEPITNVVYMGMGEPFLNYKNVIQASNIMNDKNAFNIGARRITISTAGILPKINQFINEKIKYNLAISLNASNDSTRDKLMPINKKWPIKDLINAARDYNQSHRMKITFEYVLIDSINDSIEDANRLGVLLKNTDCKLNIIPFNEIGSEYKRPSNNTIENFVKALHQRQQGFRILVRWSKGTDINAGCGQLATNE